jgi:DNA repair protein RAD50
MKKSSPESVAALRVELKEWEEEMARLQKLRPVLSSRDRLKDTEIPELEAKIKEQDTKIPVASAAADSVRLYSTPINGRMTHIFRISFQRKSRT